ncbi:ROK family protein [Xylocopilactobacillus apicola]|uniref:Transcriptional regulator n=1 Tax=Xylocopilactobacillus apicola TaxID=2932184 RepID=A0AAU9CUT6_9LACO|nr:ROK family protein [Xylocopilactobacillus apicola]BDR57757.1 transcriptional regulator [Xylocopilactobacillus apicola]
MKNYMAFDIGGTTVKYARVDENGKLFDRASFETVDNAQALINQMVDVVKKIETNHRLEGIGVSAPGIIRKDGFMVTGGAIQSLYDFPLSAELAKKTGLAVTVENDANAAAIAEHWIGNAVHCDNYLTIVLGTGIGGGIVINGEVYRGAHGMAGEFGWNVIHDIDLSENLEDYSLNLHAAVVYGLIRRYNASKKRMGDDKSVNDAREILEAADQGELLAQKAVDEFMQDLVVMLLNLFANFDPELILIGGGISANVNFMELLNRKLAEYVNRHGSISRIKNISLGQVKPAKLCNDAGLVGATYQIKKYLEKEGK